MPISMVVTNKQPEIGEDVPRPILNLFQDYTFSRDGQRHYPFKHQAETFRLVGMENKEAFHVAGTASGKTLAIAIPLFWKLKQGLIRKVLLMYPTVALLEDQRKVMVSDLVASYCYEKGRDFQALFGEARRLGELVEMMIERADEVEEARDYGLAETLQLLAVDCKWRSISG